jgi:hypothetical protein
MAQSADRNRAEHVCSARTFQTSSFVRIDQTCLASSGGLAPISFPLFQGVRFGVGRIEPSSSMVILLGLREDDMVRCNA